MKKSSSRFGLWIGALAAIIIGILLIAKIAQGPGAGGVVSDVVSDDWAVGGGVDAPVTMIEYSDFQCPACRTYYPILERLQSEFGESMQFVYRHYPLRQIHPNAAAAAAAAEAAGRQGKFWEMHNMLFERQASWSDLSQPNNVFAEYADELGLDVEQFRTDSVSDEVQDRVRRDEASGTRAGVPGTPSLFLNGERINNPNTYEDLRQLVIDAGGVVSQPSYETKSAE